MIHISPQLFLSCITFRAVLYRRFHPFILASTTSQHRIPGLIPDYFGNSILMTNLQIKLQSNSRIDSVVSFSVLLPCPIPISEDQSLRDQISTQDSRFKPRYQNQKLPNMANHWIHQKVKKYRSPTFPILYSSPLLLLQRKKEFTILIGEE